MGIISRVLIASRPSHARLIVSAGYTMVTTPRVASYFDARSGSLSDSFYLEDDGPHAVGTAADEDSLLVEVGDVAAEAQGPDVVVDCLPCGGAEALGHPQVLLDARAQKVAAAILYLLVLPGHSQAVPRAFPGSLLLARVVAL